MSVMDKEVIGSPNCELDFRPRYDLAQEELDRLDRGIVDAVKAIYLEEGVYSALIDPGNPFSNFVRGHEARHFPEAAEFPAAEERNTILFALVDTRSTSDRVVHVGTVSGPGLHGEDAEAMSHAETTGFLFVDELVELGNFTPQEFKDYYAGRFDLNKCIAVETNIKVGESAEKFHDTRTVDLGYLTLFGLIERNNPEVDGAAVFASINRLQALSFSRVGIECEPLMGRNDMVTPEAQLGRTSTPVAIVYNEQYRQLFKQFGPQLPSVRFGVV